MTLVQRCLRVTGPSLHEDAGSLTLLPFSPPFMVSDCPFDSKYEDQVAICYNPPCCHFLGILSM